MTIKLSVKSDVRQVAAQLRAYAADMQTRAVPRALNKTATTVRKVARQEIRARFTLKARSIGKRLWIDRATRARPWVDVIARDYPISLASFKAQWTQRTAVGARVQIQTAGSGLRLAGAFIRTLPRTGRRAVLMRVGKARLPLRVLTSREVPEAAFTRLFLDGVVQAAAKLTTETRFPIVLAQELNFEALRRG